MIPPVNCLPNKSLYAQPLQKAIQNNRLQTNHILQDEFISQSVRPSLVHSNVQFGKTGFKKLVKDYKKLEQATLSPEEQQKRAETFALDLFITCTTEQSLMDFAKQTGMVIHIASEGSALANKMNEDGAQGYAIYPFSKVNGQTPALKERMGTGPGFAIIEECETLKKPLVLMRKQPQDEEFNLYVLKHELFHIIQETTGNHPWTVSNTYNESLAANWHLDFLKKLRFPNTIQAREITQKAEQGKNYPVPEDSGNTFGQAFRKVTSLDMQAYEFFCKHADSLKFSVRLKRHNENLKKIYETMKFFTYEPDYNVGLSSVPMIRT